MHISGGKPAKTHFLMDVYGVTTGEKTTGEKTTGEKTTGEKTTGEKTSHFFLKTALLFGISFFTTFFSLFIGSAAGVAAAEFSESSSATLSK